jgi:adaptin ear-binding coat-associated protein 1/2
MQRSGGNVKSKFFEQGANNSSEEKSERKESIPCIKLPPPPPSPGSPVTPQKSPTDSPTKLSLEKSAEVETSKIVKETEHEKSPENQSTQDVVDDDFGDFQAAG